MNLQRIWWFLLGIESCLLGFILWFHGSENIATEMAVVFLLLFWIGIAAMSFGEGL